MPITVPLTFTVAPTYLPDAPFVNRLYGESSFNNLVFGAKFRFTDQTIRWALALSRSIAGIRTRLMISQASIRCSAAPVRVATSAISVSIGFVDGRLSKHVNVSANGGYILNSNPKGVGGDFVLLDRPDELLAGVGFDFPVNEHFQPIAEVDSTQLRWWPHAKRVRKQSG